MKICWPWRFALALLLGASSVVVASTLCASAPPGADAGGEAAALQRQAEAWDQAIIAKDRDAIAANMSEDFRQIGRSGEISDKATFLQDIMSPDLVIHPYTVEDFDVRFYGDCALLCGTTRMTGTYKGETFQSHYRYVDTYVRVDGRWKVCNVQISGFPE